MWFGFAAGPVALFTILWTFPILVVSRQVTFHDQQLNYTGSGWKTEASPQACSQVSQTMHSTSAAGDSVFLNFMGTGVIVRGPTTSKSIPLLVILDGQVQPLSSSTACSSGCSILYANGNLTIDTRHSLQVVQTAVNESATLTICGISVIDPPPNSPSPGSLPVVTVTSPPASIPTYIAGLGDVGAYPTASSSFVINPSPTTSGGDSPSPITKTTKFTVTPGMLIAIIVAIGGTILAMLALLFSCIFIRRRVSRNAARRRDRENSFFGVGKGVKTREDEEKSAMRSTLNSLPSAWSSSSGRGSLSNFVMETAFPGVPSPSIRPISSLHSRESGPISIASGLGKQLRISKSPSIISSLPRSSFVSNSTNHRIDLPGFMPGTPSEYDDYSFVLPSPRSDNTDRSLLRQSIPIGIYSPPRPTTPPRSIDTPPGLPTPPSTNRGSMLTSNSGATLGSHNFISSLLRSWRGSRRSNTDTSSSGRSSSIPSGAATEG